MPTSTQGAGYGPSGWLGGFIPGVPPLGGSQTEAKTPKAHPCSIVASTELAFTSCPAPAHCGVWLHGPGRAVQLRVKELLFPLQQGSQEPGASP